MSPHPPTVFLPAPAAPASGARPCGSVRCCERGCVFPVCSGASGRCLHHQRQQAEPRLFCSWQPTRLLLERAAYHTEAREIATLSSLSLLPEETDRRP